MSQLRVGNKNKRSPTWPTTKNPASDRQSDNMPVHKVREDGRVGYQWGNSGKVYFGPGAMRRATRQGQAAHAAGYRESAKKKKW
jgi:hypothetical protein